MFPSVGHRRTMLLGFMVGHPEHWWPIVDQQIASILPSVDRCGNRTIMSRHLFRQFLLPARCQAARLRTCTSAGPIRKWASRRIGPNAGALLIRRRHLKRLQPFGSLGVAHRWRDRPAGARWFTWLILRKVSAHIFRRRPARVTVAGVYSAAYSMR